MKNNKKSSTKIADEILVSKIYLIRGQKVMIDRDLAELYGEETKTLKRAVRRKIARFPSDFMFEMNKTEFKNWRYQIGTSNSEKMGLRHPPFCFTEQGVLMLSSVLNTDIATKVNIRLVRLFIRLRELLSTNKDILLKLQELERKVGTNSTDITTVFSVLRKLLNPKESPRKRIGYKSSKEK